ncbi:MAG: sigma-70 family RNA polymerase sigma factor [Rudaea sp.]|uniref:RNA polymerase sigma factor n=1 Tax=unclassified Rudaea TaxID=2627037 RepID=UPI0010F445E5|nr:MULTISPECIES: sigma-70 family RNA polymerase sigma factor [unclassified Rudaea]MBN8888402.1 sigma-70 family RNA polymerase sigma factor [Rudaea sp.]MBR0345722.1 sigma-70 family RNA polymerase sigma factor [Rudaea sp.]
MAKQRIHDPSAAGPWTDGPAPGNPHARTISELFEAHNRALVSFLTNRLGNEAEAREVAQEAYVRLLQLHEPGTVSFLRAYLFRVATNLSVDRLRMRARSERYDPIQDAENLTDTVQPEQKVSASEALDIVRRALNELPKRYRQILYMDRLGDKTAIQIGKELGIGERQVRTYLRRTLMYCQLRLDGVAAEEAMDRIITL